MGGCDKAGRVAVLHRNIKGMIAQFTTVFGDADINIEDMMNKSRGDYAYTLLDIGSQATAEVIDKLTAVEGVLKVRIVK